MAMAGGAHGRGGNIRTPGGLQILLFFLFVLFLYIRVTHFQGGGDCRPTQRVEVFGVLEGCLLSRAMCLAGGKLRALTPTA